MCLLAIETTKSTGSYALLKDDKIIYQDIVDVKVTHSETIMCKIDSALQSMKIEKSDLKGICVSNGPGSFTGCRIGLATAKGICTGLKIPLLTFNTLQILASNVYGTNKQILSVLDARMNEVYVAVFDQNLTMVSESHCRSYKSITDGLQGEYICVGDVNLITDESNRFQKALQHQNIIHASSMFSLIKYKNIEIKYDEEFNSNVEPFYIRSAVGK